MSMKKLAMMSAIIATIAMTNEPPGTSRKEPRRILTPNERRKCFYKFCKNMRPNSMDLYCCEECKIKARQYQK